MLVLKKPFLTPVLTEFGRFEDIVLGPDNPHCEDPQPTPAHFVGQTMGCDSAGDAITSPKPDPFCDAWHPCGSSS